MSHVIVTVLFTITFIVLYLKISYRAAHRAAPPVRPPVNEITWRMRRLRRLGLLAGAMLIIPAARADSTPVYVDPCDPGHFCISTENQPTATTTPPTTPLLLTTDPPADPPAPAPVDPVIDPPPSQGPVPLSTVTYASSTPTVATTPEPSALLLFGSGVLALSGLWTRRVRGRK